MPPYSGPGRFDGKVTTLSHVKHLFSRLGRGYKLTRKCGGYFVYYIVYEILCQTRYEGLSR